MHSFPDSLALAAAVRYLGLTARPPQVLVNLKATLLARHQVLEMLEARLKEIEQYNHAVWLKRRELVRLEARELQAQSIKESIAYIQAAFGEIPNVQLNFYLNENQF